MKYKYIVIAAAVLLPHSSHALSAFSPFLCCIGDSVGGTCSRYECDINGKTHIYTDCGSCPDSNQTLVMQVSDKPCGMELDSSFGECVTNAIINPDPISCAIGEYGDGLLTCTACPTPGTSAKGARKITDCYIANGTTGSDSTGSYKYTSDCYYSN